MCNLNQIIQLNTITHDCSTHCCSIDYCIGADLNIILHLHITNLRYFFICSVFLWCKSKSIRSDHNTRMYDDIFPNLTIMINLHPWIECCIISNRYFIANIDLWVNFHVISNGSSVSNIYKCTDITSLADLRFSMYKMRLLTSAFVKTELIIHIQNSRESSICILHPYDR